jgi:hypothetical protein
MTGLNLSVGEELSRSFEPYLNLIIGHVQDERSWHLSVLPTPLAGLNLFVSATVLRT